MADLLRREIALNCSPAHAFRTFTECVDLWWPRGHRKSEGGALRFTADALIDTAADGNIWTMATVRAFDPPHRLELDWFPGSPLAPTRVAIAFAPSPDGTRITIVHQPLSAGAAAIWPQRVATFARGWDAVIAALHDHIEGETDG